VYTKRGSHIDERVISSKGSEREGRPSTGGRGGLEGKGIALHREIIRGKINHLLLRGKNGKGSSTERGHTCDAWEGEVLLERFPENLHLEE